MSADESFALPSHLSESDMRPRARATDPATSHAAAAKAKRFVLSHAQRITGVLWRPMIPSEIARLTGLTVVQIDRRRVELIEAGEIRLTGRERDGFEEWERVLP